MTSPAESVARRHAYVICLDALHTSFASLVQARKALERFFQQEQSPDSQYAVIALGRKMTLVQDTTSNPTQVLNSLSERNFRKALGQGLMDASRSGESQYETQLQKVRGLCDAGDPTCPMLRQMLPAEAQALAEQERLQISGFLEEFRAVVRQLAAARGRHTLIFISDGFLLTPGQIPFGLLNAYFPELQSTLRMEEMQSVLEPVLRLASKGNVPIYTIDSRGLYTSTALDASRSGGGVPPPLQAGNGPPVLAAVQSAFNNFARDELLTLTQIADATGGTAFRNNNDVAEGLKRAFADAREYYVLAYIPVNAAQDGRFRTIKVLLKDDKGTVTAKRGYWAESKDTTHDLAR
jgi:VWFA-related protein